MPTQIADLAKRLTELGWSEEHASFGRQSWKIPTTEGHAQITVRADGNGIVGEFVLREDHPADGMEEGWSEDIATLPVGPENDHGLRVHRSEADVANILARYAYVLAATIDWVE